MGAPFGNQNASGHGRPKKYTEAYIQKEANDLLEWSKKDDSLNLYDFCDEKEYNSEYLTRWSSENDYFSQCYKKAKDRLSSRREKKLHANTFNYGVWNRQARVYDNLLVQREDQDENEAAERKARYGENNSKQPIHLYINDNLISDKSKSSA